MFEIKSMNENYVNIFKDGEIPTFTISNCKISSPPFIFNNKYYLILKPPPDVFDTFRSIKQILETKNIRCKIPNEQIRIKIKFKYNKFISKFNKNQFSIPYDEVKTDDLCNAELEFPGIFKSEFQLVLKTLSIL
jgi:hypothetical protein